MNLRNNYVKAISGIIVLFCLGLVFYFAFSAPYGDGLERTMEEGEAEEGEPSYAAPFDYGDDYANALAAGILGFIIVLLCVLLFAKFMRKKDEARDS
ncbi:MAG: cobalt transporter [Thermoplasmata archaeon]|nr:MAG: cobalt transporter [Thermoplasmata archaeon]